MRRWPRSPQHGIRGGEAGQNSGPGSETAPTQQPLGLTSPPLLFKPTFEEAVKYLSPRGGNPVGKDKSVFYSGGDDYFETSDTYAAQNSLIHFDGFFSKFEPEGFEVGILDLDENETYLKIISAAFGRGSSGEVRVFLPPEGLTSTFSKLEWRELVANGQVTKITWINEADTSMTKVIWKDGDGAIPFPLNSPISVEG